MCFVRVWCSGLYDRSIAERLSYHTRQMARLARAVVVPAPPFPLAAPEICAGTGKAWASVASHCFSARVSGMVPCLAISRLSMPLGSGYIGGVPGSLRWLLAFAPEELTASEYERVVGSSSSWVRGVAGGVVDPDMCGFAPVNLRPVPSPRGRTERPKEATAGLPYKGAFSDLTC